jgi:hypothetical protein
MEYIGIDNDAIILGELVIELEFPTEIAKLINSYITPNIIYIENDKKKEKIEKLLINNNCEVDRRTT